MAASAAGLEMARAQAPEPGDFLSATARCPTSSRSGIPAEANVAEAGEAVRTTRP